MRVSLFLLLFLFLAFGPLACSTEVEPITAGDSGTLPDGTASDSGVADGAFDAGDVSIGDSAVDSSVDSGVADSGTDTSPLDASLLRFGPVTCAHDPLSIAPPVGSTIACRFDVFGSAGRMVDFTCEDASGAPTPCDCTSPVQVQPCTRSERTIPFVAEVYAMVDTSPRYMLGIIGDDGSTTVTGGVDRATALANANGLDDVPQVRVDCGGDIDLDVDGVAGTALHCNLLAADGDDVGSLRLRTAILSGPGGVVPVGALGASPVSIDFRITSSAADVGSDTEIQFTAEDATHTVAANLLVRHR